LDKLLDDEATSWEKSINKFNNMEEKNKDEKIINFDSSIFDINKFLELINNNSNKNLNNVSNNNKFIGIGSPNSSNNFSKSFKSQKIKKEEINQKKINHNQEVSILITHPFLPFCIFLFLFRYFFFK
jgi:Fe2+ transport system protein B